MIKLNSFNSQKNPIRILVAMLIILCLGSFLVFYNSIKGRGKRVKFEMVAFKDSLLTRRSSAKKSLSLSRFMELYQEKQLLKSLQQKDSLDQKDILAIKEIDQKLNNLLNEKD